MGQEFIFVGDPGAHAAGMLNTLRDAGLGAKRVAPIEPGALIEALSATQPVSLMFDSGVADRTQFISSIKEIPQFSKLPLIVKVPSASPGLLQDAFCDGVDDYIVDGADHQFQALVSILCKNELWNTVRAPVGQVILAHPDRFERIRLSAVLRQNGYDTHFAGSIDDLVVAAKKEHVRAILASTALGKSEVVRLVCQDNQSTQTSVPWVIIAQPSEMDEVAAAVCHKTTVRLFETNADAQGVTFLMNELLAPPAEGVRRSTRILYGTPVKFTPQDGSTAFFGFTFNINLGGIYIRTLTSFPLQTRLEVTFKPPYGRGQVAAVAQVVWRKLHGDVDGAVSPAGMGIQFIDMWQADRAGYEMGYKLLLEQDRNSMVTPHIIPSV